MNAVRPVLLIEDDAAIRRLVSIALEDLPIELHQADTVAEGLRQLAARAHRLIISDLMLPDGSGLDVLRRLHADPGHNGQAQLAVFSAGVSDAQRAELAKIGVRQVLPKPISIAALADFVRAAIGEQGESMATASASSAAEAHIDADAQRRAINEFFIGDAALYASFRASAVRQFANDVRQADRARESADPAAFRRVVHSLKTVLLTLGHPALSAMAATLEHAAAAGNLEPVMPQWLHLRAALLSMVE